MVLSIFIFIQIQYSRLRADNIDPVQTPHFAASDLGLHCLPYVPQNGTRLICIKGAYLWHTSSYLFQ